MRKAQVWKEFTGSWRVQVGELLFPGSGYARCATHAEAIYFAQLLADPERYIRQAEQRAWKEGHKAGVLQEYFRVPGVPNTPSGETQ